MTDTGSTVPRRQLGRQTKALRRAAGYTSEIAADELGWSRSKVWRIENGRTPATKSDVIALTQLYRADERITELLLALAAESRSFGWWHAYGDVLPDWFEPFVNFEASAETIHHYDAELVPGLLQTEEYCNAIYRVFSNDDRATVERRVALRMERQALLTREDPAAPDFKVLLNEAVIRRPVGGSEAMRRQLARLAESTDMPNVDVRVLPFAAGEHAAMMSTFVVMSFAEHREPDIVYLESRTGSLYLDKPKEVTKYNFALRDLERRALDPYESRNFIAEAAKEM